MLFDFLWLFDIDDENSKFSDIGSISRKYKSN